MSLDDPPDPRQLTGAELHALYGARIRAGQVKAGIELFERICRANPRWGLSYDLLGRLYEADGQDDRAYEAYRTGMEIGLRSRRMSRELKTDLVVKVVEFCTARDWKDRADRHLEVMARLAPRHPLIPRLREATGADEMRTLSRHLDRRQEAQALVHAARDRFEANDLDEARRLYHQAIEVDDRCTNAYIFLAQTYSRLGPERLAEGLEYYRELVERRASWGLGFNLLGQLYEAAGRDDDAYLALNRAADLSDTSPTLDRRRKAELRAHLVRFCASRGWVEREAHQRERVRALQPRHPVLNGARPRPERDSTLAAARAAAQGGRRPAAVKLYQEAIARDGRNRTAHVELAQLYEQLDAEGQARGVTYFEAVVEHSPRWGLAWKLLGELRAATGDDEGAYAAIRKATEMGLTSTRLSDGVKVDNLLELVDFCNRRGWDARALNHVDQVLALQPDHPAGRALRGLLTRVRPARDD